MSQTLQEMRNGDCQHIAMEAIHISATLRHTLSSTILDAGSGPKTLTSGWLSPVQAEQREMSATQWITLNFRHH